MPNSRFAFFGGRFILAFAVLVGIIGVFGIVNAARFHSRVAKLKADGELVDIDDLIVHVENAKDDAMTYLSKLGEAANEISKVIPRDGSGRVKTDEASNALFDSTMANHPDFFEQFSLAAKAPEMSFEVNEDGSWGANILDLQKIMLVQGWKGDVLNARGDSNGAASAALELLQVAENLKPSTLLNSFLSVAFRVVACEILYEAGGDGSIDSEILEDVFSKLDNFDGAQEYCSALKSDRSIIAYYIINGLESDPQLEQAKIEILIGYVPSGAAMVWGNSMLDDRAEAIKRSKMPLTEQFTGKPAKWSILSQVGMASTVNWNGMRNAAGKKWTVVQATRIALTLQHDKLASQRDSWPVDYLVSLGIPEKMTNDPFTGEPMVVAFKDGNWQVYSKGLDKIDNGHAPESDDIGVRKLVQ